MNKNTVTTACAAVFVVGCLYWAATHQGPSAEIAPPELQQSAARSTARYNKGCGDDAPSPVIWLDDLKGPEVAVARWWEWRVVLKRSVVKSRPEVAINSTVPHEVGHLLVHRRFGDHKEPHGPEFRQMEAYLTGVLSECPWK